ncbi:MAG: hypothetical protein ABIR70_19060 [Bryobacteraceae bacterium]
MPTIQVREVPEHIYRKLTEGAKQECRSLSQQIVATLAKGLELEADPKQRRKHLLAEIRASQPIRWAFDPVASIREDRDR